MTRRRYYCHDRTCGGTDCANCYPGGDPMESDEEREAREEADAEAEIARRAVLAWPEESLGDN